MSISAAELKFFQSANMPENDTNTSGGAIVGSGAGIVAFTDITAAQTDTLKIKSDGTDTRTGTVTGRNPAGAEVSENFTLNGTTTVTMTTTFERILKVVLNSADASRTVTLYRSDGTTLLATLGPNVTSVRRMFYASSSESGIVIRYEKIFAKNTNSSLTLTTAIVKLTADPQARIRIGLATSKDDSGSVANRRTAPGGITFVDDNVNASIPGNTLEAGSAIGVWVEENLPANDPAFKNTFTVQLSGATT
jgi:hypothetical protein